MDRKASNCKGLLRPVRRAIGSSRDVTDCRKLRSSREPGKRSTPALTSWLMRVDQDECNATGLGSAVDPGVVGALLDQYVTGLEMHLAVVEQHVDLALHDDGVVDGARAVHQRVARRQALSGRVIADLLMQVILLELFDLGRGRRNVDDAEDRALLRRRDADIGRGAI